MKVSENFNAGATKKTLDPVTEAINKNFASIPQESATNVEQNADANAINVAEKTQNLQSPKKSTRLEPKEKFLVSMSKGERSVYKAFCALQNISMNHFVMCAMDYFKEDLENGKVTISSHSYKRNREGGQE